MNRAKKGIYKGKFPPVRIGDFLMSIQGGPELFSEPRARLSVQEQYEKLEVAIFEISKGRSLYPIDDPRFTDFSWSQLFEPDPLFSTAQYVRKSTILQIACDLILESGGEVLPETFEELVNGKKEVQ